MHRQSLFNLKTIKLDLALTELDINELTAARSSAPGIKPKLIMPDQLLPEVRKDYNRFKDEEKKQLFRENLLKTLQTEWQKKHSLSEARVLLQNFLELTKSIDDSGAIIFGDVIKRINFEKLVAAYDAIFAAVGSGSWIHSYVNLGNQSEFLTSTDFNGAFSHPLLIALIAYAAGGPIRMVDARGKDTEPLAVRAQDNMLHIDNTPFYREFKIIVTWERGKASGPKGQNFVFIPGTHKGVRDCNFTDGLSWSTEDASIFITPENIKQVFAVQKNAGIGLEGPEVVEVQDPQRPLTTIFEAGALVHHRYRTTEKNVPRSCIIVAFHRAEDNPGQFMSPEHVRKVTQEGSLMSFLFGKYQGEITEMGFMAAIAANIDAIATMINDVVEPTKIADQITIIEQHKKTLSPQELEKWMNVATDAPTVEQIKIQKKLCPLGAELSEQQLSSVIINMMKFDKHGPLDLKLYGDGHEEIRKWARNRAREMPPKKLEERYTNLCAKALSIQPSIEDLASVENLKLTMHRLIQMVDDLTEIQKQNAKLDASEKISSIDVFRSIRQLFVDLGDAIIRCDSRQAYLSTSLFIFLACDEFARLQYHPSEELEVLRISLLRNYIATAILIEKHIQLEQKQTLKLQH